MQFSQGISVKVPAQRIYKLIDKNCTLLQTTCRSKLAENEKPSHAGDTVLWLQARPQALHLHSVTMGYLNVKQERVRQMHCPAEEILNANRPYLLARGPVALFVNCTNPATRTHTASSSFLVSAYLPAPAGTPGAGSPS